VDRHMGNFIGLLPAVAGVVTLIGIGWARGQRARLAVA
jgi:hypothetical protein